MTPKEKAQHLFKVFGKKLAKRVVSEIIIVCAENDNRPSTPMLTVNYWQDVKKEIELL